MGRITVVEKNISEDMIYNWRNELRSHNDGVYVVASSQATKYKSQGFDKSEIVELLAADNFDIDVANRVASNLFNETIVEEIKPVEVAVVPTKYSDCIPVIEKSLEKYYGFSCDSGNEENILYCYLSKENALKLKYNNGGNINFNVERYRQIEKEMFELSTQGKGDTLEYFKLIKERSIL